ncbi:hypothetical protein BKA93DRAFT_754482 [Sparassis latifolia]
MSTGRAPNTSSLKGGQHRAAVWLGKVPGGRRKRRRGNQNGHIASPTLAKRHQLNPCSRSNGFVENFKFSPYHVLSYEPQGAGKSGISSAAFVDMNAHSEEHELLCDHLVEPRNPWDNWLATVELGGGLRATCGAVVIYVHPCSNFNYYVRAPRLIVCAAGRAHFTPKDADSTKSNVQVFNKAASSYSPCVGSPALSRIIVPSAIV